MFEIQEDHVKKLLIVASKVNAPMANVPKLVKTTMTAHMKMNVWTISACPRYVDCQQMSDVPTIENVSVPLGYAMVKMTVGIILMKETVQVKFQY
jgi:hypothetical protein